MGPMRHVTLLLAAVCSCVAPAAALAQYREFAFGVGYGHVFLEGSNADALVELGGVRFVVRVSWPVTEPMNDRRP